MAISDFGESLLGQQRKRQEKQQRKQERADLLGLAGTVGIGLYRNNIKKKQEEFLNNQAVRQQRLEYKNALKDSNFFVDLEEKGKTYVGGLRGYLRDTYAIPEAQRRIYASQDEESFDPDSLGSAVNSYADSFLDDLETAANSGISQSKTMGTLEDYDRDINLRAKLPTNMASAASARIFSGKTLEDLNREALENISESTFKNDAIAVSNFRSLFSSGLNVKDAEALALDIEKRMQDVKERAGVTTESIESIDTRLSNGEVVKVDNLVVKSKDYKGNLTIVSSTPLRGGQRVVETEVEVTDSFGATTKQTVKQAVNIAGDTTGQINDPSKAKVYVRSEANEKVPEATISFAKDSIIKLESFGADVVRTLESRSEEFGDESGQYLNAAYTDIAFRGSILSSEYNFNATQAMQIAGVSQINDLKREESIFNTTERNNISGIQILDGIAQINATDSRLAIDINSSQLNKILRQVEQEINSGAVTKAQLQDIITDTNFKTFAEGIENTEGGTLFSGLAAAARGRLDPVPEREQLATIEAELKPQRTGRNVAVSQEQRNLRRYKELLSSGVSGTVESVSKAMQAVENAITRREKQKAERLFKREQELYKLTQDLF
tara:strand:- start:3476 stop:5305 length:1830 start_codon:yes stop_codon:yes gene_type:complete